MATQGGVKKRLIYWHGGALLLLFAAFLYVIWGGFLNYFSYQDRVVKSWDKLPGYRLDDQQLLDVLQRDSWTGALRKYRLDTLKDLQQGSVLAELTGAQTPLVFAPFGPDHLRLGDSSWRLAANSLVVIKAYVEQYRRQPELHVLESALAYLKAYVEYERQNRFDEDFLYNDHAVAARVQNLVRLWLLLRNHPQVDVADKRLLINYALRLASRLTNRAFYNYRTNHGTMQNVSLMLLAVVFAEDPQAEYWWQLGLERLEEQLGYLVSPEGFFLEHSFGYQPFFIELLEAAGHYIDLAIWPADNKVTATKERMQRLLLKLLRHDGSLAPIGDTSAASIYTEGSWTQAHGTLVLPISGLLQHRHSLSLDCESDTATITVFWSNFAHHGHKRWDDMSLDFYACGSQWWRNIGYVPYWHPLRKNSETWLGSNSPHVSEEGIPQPQTARLGSFARGERLFFSNLERQSPQGKIIRWVVMIDTLLVVYDQLQSQTPSLPLISHWTIDADKQMRVDQQGDTRYYRFSAATEKTHLITRFFPDKVSIKTAYASSDSALGWVEQQGTMLPSHTLSLQSTSEAPYLIQLSQIQSEGQQASCILNAKPSDKGGLLLDICETRWQLEEQGEQLVVSRGGKTDRYPLQRPGSGANQKRALIDQKTLAARQKYGPYFKPLTAYRIKVSALGIGLLLLSLTCLVIVNRYLSKLYGVSVGTVGFCWLALIYWIKFYYFTS